MLAWVLQIFRTHGALGVCFNAFYTFRQISGITCFIFIVVKCSWCWQSTGILGSWDAFKVLGKTFQQWHSSGCFTMHLCWQMETHSVILIVRMEWWISSSLVYPWKSQFHRSWLSTFVSIVIFILVVTNSRFSIMVLVVFKSEVWLLKWEQWHSGLLQSLLSHEWKLEVFVGSLYSGWT